MRSEFRKFLESIHDVAAEYEGLRLGDIEKPFYLPFWSWPRVNAALPMRFEWGILDFLVPFYGDWHDLYCLNIDDGRVLALNDAREVTFEWENAEAFCGSFLRTMTPPQAETSQAKVIKFEVSDELQERVKALLEKRK